MSHDGAIIENKYGGSPKKVLIIFGSKSDKDVYKPILSKLEELDIDHIFRVCSAHRTPELLTEILADDSKHDYSCIIAGAGLAAHLPGVIASKIIKPVIGVPVHSNYSGLDAFLSIIQMPPGIPVMCVGVNQSEIAALNAAKMQTQYEYVNIIGDIKDDIVKKSAKILKGFDVTTKYSDDIDTDAINIRFVALDDTIPKSDGLVIYCPLSKEKNDVEYAINLLKHTDHGLWVGLNRGDNAALSAIEILNLDHRYDLLIDRFRQEQSDEVILHDSEHSVIREKKKKGK